MLYIANYQSWWIKIFNSKISYSIEVIVELHVVEKSWSCASESSAVIICRRGGGEVRWGGHIYIFPMSSFFMYPKMLKSVDFSRSYSKIKGGQGGSFYETHCVPVQLQPRCCCAFHRHQWWVTSAETSGRDRWLTISRRGCLSRTLCGPWP